MIITSYQTTNIPMLSHRYTEIKPKFFFNDVVSAKGTGILPNCKGTSSLCTQKSYSLNNTPALINSSYNICTKSKKFLRLVITDIIYIIRRNWQSIISR